MSLAKGILIYGASGALARAISFIVMPVLTTHLSPAEVGRLTLLNVLALFVGAFVSLGIGAGLGTTYYRESDPLRRLWVVGGAFILLVAAGLVALAVAVPSAAMLSDLLFGEGDGGQLIIWSLVGTCLGAIGQPSLLVLQFEQSAVAYSLATLLPSAFSALMSYLAVALLDAGVEGVVGAQMLAQGLGVILGSWGARRSLVLVWQRSIFGALVRDGLPFVSSMVFLLCMQHGNKYVLQYARGEHEVGLFGLGSNIGMVISVAVGAFQQAWFPIFMGFRARPRRGSRSFADVALGYSLLAGLACVGLSLFAKPVIEALISPLFHAAWIYVGLVALAQFANGWFSLMLPGLYFADRVALVGRVQCVSAIVTLALSIALVGPLGGMGCSIGGIIGSVSMVALTAVVLGRNGFYRLPVHLPALAGLGMLLGSAFLLGFIPTMGLPLRVLVFAATIAASLVVLRMTRGRRWLGPFTVWRNLASHGGTGR